MTKLQALRLLALLLSRGFSLPPTDPVEKKAIDPVIEIAGLSSQPSITIGMVNKLIQVEEAMSVLSGKISDLRLQSSDESDDNDGGGTPPGGGGPP